MGLVWLLDRATGLLAYPALWLAVASGIWYDASELGPLRDAAHAAHIPIAAFASFLVVAHGALGTVDLVLVTTGRSPVPDYGLPYLAAGVAVGAGALLVLAVAVLAFLDPVRAARPWSPTVVHWLSYVGFGFATVHGAAIGTDVTWVPTRWVVASLVVLAYMVAIREVVASDAVAVADVQ